jgi:hypothetical protein
MKSFRPGLLTLGAGAVCMLAGCAVVPPSYPTVTALPAHGKSIDTFRQEDYACRTYAAKIVDPVAQSRSTARSGAAAPVLGTAGGAAAGALIGAGAGNAGAGAAIGAGVGLLLGASAGGAQHRQTEAALQRQYDDAYAQCITAKGDRIVTAAPPPAVVVARPVYYYYAPYYY